MLPNSQPNKPAPQAGQGKKTAGVDGVIACETFRNEIGLQCLK
ncbi:conserved protein of unknown function [Limnospira indica PCC 8005]|uniref:Uncharacterized protein n=1 Tax=Limnospira indica PCC 8005 TaxID=376219 RepID=A0A9P1KCA6_9CYAN|nr:conserved protein of unknown function [Limnospira indica PCC 8005]